jgi:hypothetical protein
MFNEAEWLRTYQVLLIIAIQTWTQCCLWCSCSQKIISRRENEKTSTHRMPCGFSQRNATKSNAVVRAKTIFCLMNNAVIYSGARPPARTYIRSQKAQSKARLWLHIVGARVLKWSHSCIAAHFVCLSLVVKISAAPTLFARVLLFSLE